MQNTRRIRYLKEFSTKHYRALKSFRIGGLSQVNLIGGLNGSGKTSFLEAVFSALDVKNPLAFTRVLQWRGLPANIDLFEDLVLSGENCTKLTFKTHNDKEFVAEFQPEHLPVRSTTNLTISSTPSTEPPDNALVKGMRIRLRSGQRIFLDRELSLSESGFMVHDVQSQPQELPFVAIISRYTLNNQNDMTSKYSLAVKKGRKKELIEISRKLGLLLEDLELLQVADQSILHAFIPGAGFIPLSLAGDGILTMLTVALTIMQAEDGMILLDEFDAAIHYTKLPMLWEIIISLANQYNCQVFSASHSKESIDAAVTAACAIEDRSNLKYYRFDMDVDRNTVVTSYDMRELYNAVDEDWEVR